MFLVKISEINDNENVILSQTFETEQQMNKFLFDLKSVNLEVDINKRKIC